jgi:hypothetical protein
LSPGFTNVLLGHSGPILASAVDTWATVAVAIGTIGAVVYALFRDVVVTPRRRPKLELLFDGTGSDQVVVATGGGDVGQVRLRVANGAGKDTADDVVVLVTEVRRLDETTGVAEVTPILLPLTWSGSNPPLTVASVHPGSQRHVDLVHVELPARDAVLRLDVTPKPPGDRDRLAPGAFEIPVEIRARNADAVSYVIPVAWDGTRNAKAPIWDHLRVGPPRSSR